MNFTMKIEKLHISSEEFNDFNLIGISCSEKDYRLCWALNQTLGTDMVRMSNEGIPSREHLVDFPFFEYVNEEQGAVYRLLANRFESKTLMKELRSIDYLFILTGIDLNVSEIVVKIGAIDFVFLATEIDVSKLKERDLLILDE